MAVNLSPVAGAAAQFFDNSGQVLTGGKLYIYLAGTTTPAPTYTTSAGTTPHPNPIVLNAAGRVPDSGEIWLTDSISYKFVLKDQNDVLIATYDNLIGINSNFVNFTGQEETQTATQGQTVFTLTTIEYQPNTNNLLVFVNGSKQILTDNYTETSATVVTFVDGLNVGDIVDFCTAVPINSNIATAASVSLTGFKGQIGNVQDLASDDGANWIGYTYPITGAVPESVGDRLAQYVSVKDFGATGDGVTDDTVAIQAAINSGAYTIGIPQGTYKFTSLTLPNNGVALVGQGRTATYLSCTATSGNAIYFSGPNAPEFRFEHFWLGGPGATSGNGIYLNSTNGGGLKCYINDVVVDNFQAGSGIYGGELYFSSFYSVWCRNNGYGINMENTSNANNFYNVICQWNHIAGARFFYITSVGWFGGDIEGNFGSGLIVDSVRQFYMSAVHFEQNNYDQAAGNYSVLAEGGVHTSPLGQKLNTWMTMQSCRFAEAWCGMQAQGAFGYTTTLNLRDTDLATTGSWNVTQADIYTRINWLDYSYNLPVIDSSNTFSTLTPNIATNTFGVFGGTGPIYYFQSRVNNYEVTLTQNSFIGDLSFSEIPLGLITVIVKQDATGGRTLTWNATYFATSWSNTGNTANTVSTILLVNDGTKIRQIYQAPYA